jgi:hypothetical protein
MSDFYDSSFCVYVYGCTIPNLIIDTKKHICINSHHCSQSNGV